MSEIVRRYVTNCPECGAEIDADTGKPLDTAFWREWADREHRWVHRLEDEIARLRAIINGEAA